LSYGRMPVRRPAYRV